jgi:hypothetical protein
MSLQNLKGGFTRAVTALIVLGGDAIPALAAPIKNIVLVHGARVDGPMSNAILISNNISRGRVNAFDPNSGGFLGPLRDANGNPIEIDNDWALQFGQGGGPNGAPNQLFFTGGPNGYANGTFGVITFGQ